MSKLKGTAIVYAVTEPQLRLVRDLVTYGPQPEPREGELPEAVRRRVWQTLDAARLKGLVRRDDDGWRVTPLGAALLEHLGVSPRAPTRTFERPAPEPHEVPRTRRYCQQCGLGDAEVHACEQILCGPLIRD